MRSKLKKIGLVITIAVLWSTCAAAEDFSMFSAIKTGGTFVQADLVGVWSMQALSMEGDEVRWMSVAELDILLDGNMIGAGIDSDDQDFDISGKLFLSTSGNMTGLFVLSEGTNLTSLVVADGKMDGVLDVLKNYAILVASCGNCSPDRSMLVYLTRKGSAFQQTFARGRWQIFSTGFDNDTNRLFWTFGNLSIDSSGNVFQFAIQNSRGQQVFYTSGEVKVDNTGQVNGSFEGTGSNDTVTFGGGQMTRDANQITLVTADSKQEKMLVVLVRNDFAGLFFDTDTVGSWHYYGIKFDDPADDVAWEFGDLEMVEKGTITGDGYDERGGGSGSISGNEITIPNSEGILNGSIKLNGTTRTLTFGQMNTPLGSQRNNPKSRFTFVGTVGSGSGGGGGGNVGVLPGQGTGGGNGCLISSGIEDPQINRLLKYLEQR